MPTPTTYPYTVSTDFPNGVVDLDRLTHEIQQSSIVTALARIDRHADACDVIFQAALTAAEKTTLDGDTSPPAAGSLIGAHQGQPFRTAPQRAVSNGVSSTTLTSPQDKVQLAAASVKGGPHLLHWYAETRITGGDAGATAAVDVDVNGVQVGMTRDDAAYYRTFSGTFLGIINDGDQPVITIRFQRAGGTTGTVDIRRARLFLLRVDGIED